MAVITCTDVGPRLTDVAKNRTVVITGLSLR